MLTPAVRPVIGKWMQTQRPCRVSRKLILECLPDAFWKNQPSNQKLQRSVNLGLNESHPVQSVPLGLFSAHLKTRTLHTKHAHGCGSRFMALCVLQVIVNTFQHQ